MMTRLVSAGCRALLGLSLLGLVGCGEDNEEASRAQAAKSTGLINPSKTIPPAQNQAEFYKNNPGSSPGATAAGPKGAKATGAGATAPAKKQ